MIEMREDAKAALEAAVQAGITGIVPETIDHLSTWLTGFLIDLGWTKEPGGVRLQLPKDPGPRP